MMAKSGNGSKGRPQNKNLIPLNKRSKEEARAIQSAGGKASQKVRKERQHMKDLLLLYSELPIKDGRVKNRLKRIGLPDEVLTQKMHIADALIRMAQSGSTQAIALFLECAGELELARNDAKENNLFEMIKASSSEEVSTDDLPEVLETPESDDDMVESPESEEL